MKLHNYLISLLLLFSTSLLCAQQSYYPLWYYTFDDPANWGACTSPASVSNCPTLLASGPTPMSTSANGSLIGEHLNFPGYAVDYNAQGNGVTMVNLPITASSYADFDTRQMSVEFLMHLQDFRNVFEFRTPRMKFRIYYNKIQLTVYYEEEQLSPPNSPPIKHYKTFEIYLDGKERKSLDYYLNQWRHIAITANLDNNSINLFVDGISPTGFKSFFDGNSPNSLPTEFNLESTGLFRLNEYNAIVDIDELAIYDQEIPAALICKHYSEATNGLSYNFTDNSDPNNPSLACSLSSEYNALESDNFAPGFPTSPTTEYNALKQLQTFPIPRIKSGHDLGRNFSWISPITLSGVRLKQKCIPPNAEVGPGGPYHWYSTQTGEDYERISYDFNVEMAKNWNYYLTMEGGYYKSTNPWTIAPNLHKYMSLLATNNAFEYKIKKSDGTIVHSEFQDMLEYPMGMKTFWGASNYAVPNAILLPIATIQLQSMHYHFLQALGIIHVCPTRKNVICKETFP